MDAKIITIANQKGGVAKSTTAHAIGTGLYLQNNRVLMIDLDSQSNLTQTATAEPLQGKKTALEVLQGKARAQEAIIKTPYGDLIPSSPLLTGDIKTQSKRPDMQLKTALDPLRSLYDYIIIDTPPALGLLTINAFTASKYVIIPAQADFYSLQAIGQLYNTLQAVRQHNNKDLAILGVLLTRYSGRAILSQDLKELITQTAEQLGTRIFNAVIREAIAIKEAQATQTPIFIYSPKSNPAKDYKSLIDEIIKYTDGTQ